MEKHDVPLKETLLPALLQCFGIMFLGYILGRSGVLHPRESKGISTFVLYISLPALIFVKISTISFEDVKWSFIACVFISKVFIFICVAFLTMLLTHPASLDKAGIYAITATISNDFALGYPMILSLYKNTHPNYPDYLYIIAPIQLLVLNPIGFFIMEIQAHNQGYNTSCHFLKVVKNTLKNPIVFTTIFGMLWNISFNHQVPQIFNATLQTLSDAFPATALFLVGYTMATESKKSDSHISITVALLVITKNLFLPIILQKTCSFMLHGSSENEIQSLSSFGFLYGTIPTAPSVYVYATLYDTSVDVVTKTIIGSTLISGPLMFASASVISLTEVGSGNASTYITLTMTYLSCVSLLCCCWILLSYIIRKKFQNISFGITLFIIFSQLLTSVGGILLFFEIPLYSPIFYAQYIFSIGGIFSTRVSTLFLAVLLILIRWRSLCYILQARKHIYKISIMCIVCPCFLASILLLVSKTAKQGEPCFQLGYAQTIATFTITIVCFIGTVLCLIFQHVCFRYKQTDIIESINPTCETNFNDELTSPSKSTDVNKTNFLVESNEDISVDVEDLDRHFRSSSINSETLVPDNIESRLCDSRYQCSVEKRLQCATKVSEYQRVGKLGLYDNEEIFQHTFLLIWISVAMTVSLAVCFWKLIMERVNGIFIELEFLDVILNYSLGIFFFIIFWFDKGVIFTISKKWKTFWSVNKQNSTGTLSAVDICQDFITKHKENFQADIEKSKTNHCRECHSLFCSSDIIKWLMENEEMQDINDAETYILQLIEGHVIEKVDKCEFFSDGASIFRFTNINELTI